MSSITFSDSLQEVNEILKLYDGSSPTGGFQYDFQYVSANKSSSNYTLDSINDWNHSDFLHFCADHLSNLNDSEMTKVCHALQEHLTKKKPPFFALSVENYKATCSKSFLDLLESTVMSSLPAGTKTILSIYHPTNDLMLDWVVHLNNNSSVEIDYFKLCDVDYCTLKDVFFESFAFSCCSIKVLDIWHLKIKPGQFDKVLQFFSTFQTSVLRLRCAEVPGTQREIRGKLRKTVSVAAKKGLLTAGIEWWNGGKWILFEASAADKAIGHKIVSANSTEKNLADAKALLKFSSQNLNKLVFVGEAGSGKSSVLRSLEGKSFEKLVSSKNDDQAIESMHLVELTPGSRIPWTVKKETPALLGSMKNGKEQYLNVVDINGAKYFSMLLKLAITNKTVVVYCVKIENLLSNESEEIEKICSALMIVERLAPGCAIVIVSTFAAHITEDSLKKLNLSMRKAIFAKGIKRLFPNVLGQLYFHPLENSTAGNNPKMVESLRHTIFTIITGQAGFNQEVPDFYPLFIGYIKESWIKVASLVHLPKVDSLGKQGGLTPKDVEAALAWAHDTGLIQYYGMVDDKFKQTIVMNPAFMYQMFQSYLYDGINRSRSYSAFSENGQDVNAYEMEGVLNHDLLLSFWCKMPDDESKFLYDLSFHFRLLLQADDPLIDSQVKMKSGQQLVAVPAMMPNWKGHLDWIKFEKSMHDEKRKYSETLAGEEIPFAEAIP